MCPNGPSSGPRSTVMVNRMSPLESIQAAGDRVWSVVRQPSPTIISDTIVTRATPTARCFEAPFERVDVNRFGLQWHARTTLACGAVGSGDQAGGSSEPGGANRGGRNGGGGAGGGGRSATDCYRPANTGYEALSIRNASMAVLARRVSAWSEGRARPWEWLASPRSRSAGQGAWAPERFGTTTPARASVRTTARVVSCRRAPRWHRHS
jgi:hypothetical protein